TWQLQHAKNKLSEVVDRAVQEGPQVISRRGVETAVVVSVRDYRKLVAPKEGLVAFLRASPLVEIELNLESDSDPGRDVDL
ncbi:MAG: type II toxin-antitoxin system Phd/YefM family antitoxin, partial [Acidobacteria bacterium]|nr:type II toxin-antitoxin system Phd/YefM family antitoxin [Acidobacteriota bacterium]